jgi:RNA polymerase sigma-70 factor (ECF subfamily)
MVRKDDALRRWLESGDVFQNAVIRLQRALEGVTPESVEHFFRLAAVQIRRELRDLGRHYFGREGLGANYESHVFRADSGASDTGSRDGSEDTNNPNRLAEEFLHL